MTNLIKKNAINGILLLNKPLGVTSNKVLQKVKHLFSAAKAGHTGSLDPLATGMLPICFGEATKVCHYLLNAHKCYTTTGLLGIKTNTSDAAGTVIARCENFSISQEQLMGVLNSYQGAIEQTPSMYSALKHQGLPLYHFARKGIDIVRQPRTIVIESLTLNSFDGQYFSLTVECSKGTYIRNLVEDIGDALGVGAYVTQLHRVHTANFQNDCMYSLADLEAMSAEERLSCLIAMDKAIEYLPAIILSPDEIYAIRQGKVVVHKTLHDTVDCVRLYSKKNQFIGLGEYCFGALKAKRLIAFAHTNESIVH